MRGSHGLLVVIALAAIGCQSPPPAADPFLRSRVPPPPTGQIAPIPSATYGTVAPPPPAVPGGIYTPPGGTLTPVTPPPSSMAPPPAALPPASPYGGAPAPMYSAPPASIPPSTLQPPPSTAPPVGGPPYTPPNGGWAPTSSSGGPPVDPITTRAAMDREVRPLADSTRPGQFAHAASGGTNDSAPEQQGVEPPQDLSDTPMAAPLRNSRDTRDIEPVSYAQPQGPPPRMVRGAYASTAPGRKRAPRTRPQRLLTAARARSRAAADRPIRARLTATTPATPGCKASWSIPKRPGNGSSATFPSTVPRIAMAAASFLPRRRRSTLTSPAILSRSRGNSPRAAPARGRSRHCIKSVRSSDCRTDFAP